MPGTHSNHRGHVFGEFTLDIDRRALLCGREDIKLRPKSFDVLRYLVERQGTLVTREALLDSVWDDTIVTEDSVTQCLIEIRRAIGDRSQTMIKTVPRRGYIFDLAVTELGDEPESVVATTGPPTAGDRPVARLGAALIFLLAVATGWWMFGNHADVEDSIVEPAVVAAPNSIAVLAFDDMSSEGDQEFFADGISEEILTLLAKIPSLQVIARTSSFSFKGQSVDIAMIGETLNVAHVLEGSVRKSGNRVRITAQLVTTSDSMHLWSESYDRELGDILAVQAEIATAVADALDLAINQDELLSAAHIPVAEAHENYLQGRFFHNRRGPGDSEKARQYFERAIEADPEYGQPWVGLLGVYSVQWVGGVMSDATADKLFAVAVEKALELAPEFAETHVRAAGYFAYQGDSEAAEYHRQRALTLDPNDPILLGNLAGGYAWRDQWDEAIETQRRATQVDPLGYVNRGNYAGYLYANGQFDKARDEYRKALELNPAAQQEIGIKLAFIHIFKGEYEQALAAIETWPQGMDRDLGLALAYRGLGEDDKADDAVAKLIATPGMGADVRTAKVYARAGKTDEAFRWLDAASRGLRLDQLDATQYQLIQDIQLCPFLHSLHSDSRWKTLFAAN